MAENHDKTPAPILEVINRLVEKSALSLVGAVEGILTDTIRAHLKDCPTCATRMRDLFRHVAESQSDDDGGT